MTDEVGDFKTMIEEQKMLIQSQNLQLEKLKQTEEEIVRLNQRILEFETSDYEEKIRIADLKQSKINTLISKLETIHVIMNLIKMNRIPSRAIFVAWFV